MSVKIIYFVHGTTSDNASKLCSGWKDVLLNDLGREQALNLGKVSKERGDMFDVMFTSDLQRAIDSADYTFKGIKYGDLDGKHKSLVIYEEHISEKFPNGESLEDVYERVNDFVSYLKENYDGMCVGIVAHRAPQLVLESISKGISLEEAINNDWRKTGDWQPGWIYEIK